MENFEELMEIDAEYEPFPKFSDWLNIEFHMPIWEEITTELKNKREEVSEEYWNEALNKSLRMAAIDTGAIENLYQLDRGFTFSVAIEKAAWEEENERQGVDIKRFFDAQLKGYEITLNTVANSNPISEAWIRQLHKDICEPQVNYKVITSVGPQEHELPKGEYKKHPNHVKLPDGSFFAYSPVDQVSPEMHRLIKEINSDEFLSSHPIIQSAYSHYALVKIHPFADGNGRVARALASFYLTKVASIPLIIFVDERDQYYDSLSKADERNYKPFVKFIYERAIETIRIQIYLINSSGYSTAEKILEELNTIYKAFHDLSHDQVDDIAYNLINKMNDEFNKKFRELQSSKPNEIELGSVVNNTNYQSLIEEGFRAPLLNRGRQLSIFAKAKNPASANVDYSFLLFISTREREKGEILLKSQNETNDFRAKLSDIHPNYTNAFLLMVEIWVDGITNKLLEELKILALGSFKKSGYSQDT